MQILSPNSEAAGFVPLSWTVNCRVALNNTVNQLTHLLEIQCVDISSFKWWGCRTQLNERHQQTACIAVGNVPALQETGSFGVALKTFIAHQRFRPGKDNAKGDLRLWLYSRCCCSIKTRNASSSRLSVRGYCNNMVVQDGSLHRQATRSQVDIKRIILNTV